MYSDSSNFRSPKFSIFNFSQAAVSFKISNSLIRFCCVGLSCPILEEGRKEMFYLTTHSTHFIYGYMASDIWLRTILIVREETRFRQELLFPTSSKGSFICTIPQTG